MKATNYIQMMNFEAIDPIGEIATQLILFKAFDHSNKVNLSETCTVSSANYWEAILWMSQMIFWMESSISTIL